MAAVLIRVSRFLVVTMLATALNSENTLRKSNIKQYVLDNLDTLKNLVERKDKTKASFDLREMFSSYAEDANSLLTKLDNTDEDLNEGTKQEMIEQIAKHMEILQKLLNIMNHEMPSMEMHRFCQSSEPFHDAICRRPVKKIMKQNNDLKPIVGGKVSSKKLDSEEELIELGAIN